MKRFAYALIAVGFLAGAYFTVLDTEGVVWSGAVPSLIVGLVGVAIVQVLARRAQGETETGRSSIDQLEQSLARIVGNAAELDRTKTEVDTYEMRHRIDELFMADLDIFVEGRESIGHAYGLQAYAEVMTSFATGERYLNRCWSASNWTLTRPRYSRTSST